MLYQRIQRIITEKYKRLSTRNQFGAGGEREGKGEREGEEDRGPGRNTIISIN